MAENIGNVFKGITTAGTVQNLRGLGNLLINSQRLSELDDVNTSGAVANNTLIYNSATTKFEARNIYFDGDLADVVITNPQSNDRLVFSSPNWINRQSTYYSYNIFGKFKDSYISNLSSTTYINLLVNDPLVFDSYTVSGLTNNTLSLSGNFITGFRTGANYQMLINGNISILTIDNLALFTVGFRNSADANIVNAGAQNTLNNPNRPINLNHITTISASLIYPFFGVNATIPNNYTGQTTTDFSFSITIYEL